MGEGREADIRIGDIERGQARAMLDIHLGHGRLDPAEHEDRVSRAGAARTRRDIEALFGDLPAPRPELWEAARPAHQIVPTRPVRPARPAEPRRAEVVGVVAGLWVLTMLPAAIVLTVFTGAWWMFILFVVGVMVIGGVSEGAKRTPPPG